MTAGKAVILIKTKDGNIKDIGGKDMVRTLMELPGAGNESEGTATVGLTNGAREFQCPFCGQSLKTKNGVRCRCGSWTVRWIQKPQSGGWGAGEMISARKMVLKRDMTLKQKRK